MNDTSNVNWDQLSMVIGEASEPVDPELTDLFKLFISDASTRLEALLAADLSGDLTPVAKEAHKIRGAASSFGFDRLANVLNTVETQISTLSTDEISGLLREAEQVFETSRREIYTQYSGLED